MKLKHILAGAGVLAALTFASAASATTYDLGTLAIGSPLSKSVTATGGTVNDTFDFSIAPPPLTTYGQLIDFFVQNPQNGALLSDVFSGGTISLFNSSNALLDEVNIISLGSIGSTTFTDVINLGVGDYHFVVDGTVASGAPANYTFGVFGAAVPEPAAWAMMIMGLGLIGSTLRVRARREQGVAA